MKVKGSEWDKELAKSPEIFVISHGILPIFPRIYTLFTDIPTKKYDNKKLVEKVSIFRFIPPQNVVDVDLVEWQSWENQIKKRSWKVMKLLFGNSVGTLQVFYRISMYCGKM